MPKAAAGNDVTIVFDGAGRSGCRSTRTATMPSTTASLASATKSPAPARSAPAPSEWRLRSRRPTSELLSGHAGHPSLRALVAAGYEVITF